MIPVRRESRKRHQPSGVEGGVGRLASGSKNGRYVDKGGLVAPIVTNSRSKTRLGYRSAYDLFQSANVSQSMPPPTDGCVAGPEAMLGCGPT